MDLSTIWISALKSKFDRDPKTTTLGRLFAGVQAERWGGQVRWIRECLANGDDEAANEAKGMLPAAMPSGVFGHRGDSSIIKYSGILCIDIDDVENIEEMRDTLTAMPWICGLFTSPSGAGLKAFCWSEETDPLAHGRVFASVRNSLAQEGIIVDEKCKNLERLCFVSSDESAFLRKGPPVAVDRSIPLDAPRKAQEWYSDLNDLEGAKESLAALGPAIAGHGGEAATRRAILIGRDHGLSVDAWMPFLLEWNKKAVPPWPERDLYAKARSNYAGARKPMGHMALLAGLI